MLKTKSWHQAVSGIPRQQICLVACWFSIFLLPLSALLAESDTMQMIRSSIASTEADWKATPSFSYVEQAVDEKGGVKSSKTYRVCMIEGSPYSRLIATGGRPLSPPENARAEEELREAIAKRANESPEARAKRLALYQKGRQRMFALLNEMAAAFDFKQEGQQRVEGHDVYVLEATPLAGYKPSSRETKVLTGMQGKLWIDKETHQWVKVEAVAIKPVWLGWFIAQVLPGTKFILEQEPVMKTLWLPKFFSVNLKARVLLFHKSYIHSETYSDYRLISPLPPASPR